MLLKFIFIIILLIILLFFYNMNIEPYNLSLVTGDNLFSAKINNIFYNDYNINLPYINNTNEIAINSDDNNKPEIKSMQEINSDAVKNSKHYIIKKTCESHKNQAICWSDQNCKWIANPNGSNCLVARTMLL